MSTDDSPIVPNGTYTIILDPDNPDAYVTLRLKGHWLPDKPNRVAEFLSGPDNEDNYTGFAFVLGRTVLPWRKFAGATDQLKALKILLSNGTWREAGEAYAIRSGNCFRCSKRLTVPISLSRGLGPECAKRMAEVAQVAVAVAAENLVEGIAQVARQTNVPFGDHTIFDEPVYTPAQPLLPPMADVLGPSGVIARTLPGYEARPQQIEAAQLIAEGIIAKEHVIVEAGTGVGKSLAYLIPAIYSRRKTIVSTGDKNLQDQLWRKDIPFLKSVLPIGFSAAILKGKANYLCVDRWTDALGAIDLQGGYEFEQVRRWVENTESGDIEELPFSLSADLQGRITSTSDACTGKHCAFFADCYAEKAKTKADQSDVVIVNHTLLCLDAAIRAKSDGYASALPDRELVIADEAHNLENAATLAFTTELSATGILRLLHDKHVNAAKVDADTIDHIEGWVDAFFGDLAKLSQSMTHAIPEPPQALLVKAEKLANALYALAKELERLNPYTGGESRDQEAYKKFVQRIKDLSGTVETILLPSTGHVVYVEKRQGQRRQLVYLKRCPISVADDLRESLFENWPVICTSATLATGDSFSYFKSRVGCDEARELVVGSPFDYKRNALIYLPMNGKEFDPTRYYQEGSPEYFDRLAAQMEQLLLASDGRAFCLFTSNKALNEVYGRIAHRLRWTVLKQGDMPRAELVKRFKEDGHAVLWGLKSFWEGVDVQGEALSLVIIDKIPFGMPDDPIYDARCKAIVKETGDRWAWFSKLALPTAIITYKQGFGRLIRTKADRGVVALLDGRLSQKNYGTTVLRSLPPATQTRSIDVVKAFFER